MGAQAISTAESCFRKIESPKDVVEQLPYKRPQTNSPTVYPEGQNTREHTEHALRRPLETCNLVIGKNEGKVAVSTERLPVGQAAYKVEALEYFEDSLRSAANIQSALRSDYDKHKEIFPESELLLKPKDIVSGDSFWMKEVGDDVLFAVLDCTGHGVPAALLTMMSHIKLNLAVEHYDLRSPAQILTKVNELVMQFLGDGFHETLGMDISLCRLNRKEKSLTFSGAKRPLYLIRSHEMPNNDLVEFKRKSESVSHTLYEWKGDSFGIGSVFSGDSGYHSWKINLLEGDRIYLHSDGYADQFGGRHNKKFLVKHFRKLLLETSFLDVRDQMIRLNETIEAWKGDNEQTDDIIVFAAEV